MKSILAAAAFLALAAPAQAQGRPSTKAMTCGQARNLIEQRGAIVLSTGPDLYDRYVSREGLCYTGTYARPAWAPTRDNPQCAIGYYCSANPPMFRR